jgi:hypothetical protein
VAGTGTPRAFPINLSASPGLVPKQISTLAATNDERPIPALQ